MLVTSLFTFLIPPMAELGSWGVMICRVMQGLSQGFFMPMCHYALSKWVPVEERSRMGTFVYAGGPFGTVIAMPLTGVISGSSVGWPAIFYIYGGLGILWTIFWVAFAADSPSTCKRISLEEKAYIETSTATSDSKKELPTPWKDIATSLPLISILVAHTGQNWGFWTLLTEIPTFMDRILKYDIESVSRKLKIICKHWFV